MNLDYHYYATYVAARIAQYSEKDAQTIAYAAQMVDDFTEESYKKSLTGVMTDVKYTAFPLEKSMNYASQATSNDRTLANIWIPFHFLPTMNAHNFDALGAKDLPYREFLCDCSGPLYKRLTDNCLKGQSLEYLGMAMHIMADTYSHWGFVGYRSRALNNIDSKGSLSTGEKFSPHDWVGVFVGIGHTALNHYPDLPYLKITYTPNWGTREITRDNPDHFYTAFLDMLNTLKGAKKAPTDKELEARALPEIQALLATKSNASDGSQKGLWLALIDKLFGDKVPDYEKNLWLDAFSSAKDKKETSLYRFANAAKTHWADVDSVVDLSNFSRWV